MSLVAQPKIRGMGSEVGAEALCQQVPNGFILATILVPDACAADNAASMAFSQIHSAAKRSTLSDFATLLAEVLAGDDQPAKSLTETARRGPRKSRIAPL